MEALEKSEKAEHTNTVLEELSQHVQSIISRGRDEQHVIEYVRMQDQPHLCLFQFVPTARQQVRLSSQERRQLPFFCVQMALNLVLKVT